MFIYHYIFRLPHHYRILFPYFMFLGVQTYLKLAAGQGIEPQLKASKASVLPLDDSPIIGGPLD